MMIGLILFGSLLLFSIIELPCGWAWLFAKSSFSFLLFMKTFATSYLWVSFLCTTNLDFYFNRATSLPLLLWTIGSSFISFFQWSFIKMVSGCIDSDPTACRTFKACTTISFTLSWWRVLATTNMYSRSHYLPVKYVSDHNGYLTFGIFGRNIIFKVIQGQKLVVKLLDG